MPVMTSPHSALLTTVRTGFRLYNAGIREFAAPHAHTHNWRISHVVTGSYDDYAPLPPALNVGRISRFPRVSATSPAFNIPAVTHASIAT